MLADPLATWVHRNPFPTAIALSRIAFGNGLFVAADQSGNLLSSADSESWDIPKQSIAGAPFMDIAFGNGRFVAITISGEAFSSSTGRDWSRVTNPATLPRSASFGKSLAFGNGKFLAAGASTNVFTSEDGLSWTPAATEFDSFNTVCFRDGQFVGTVRLGLNGVIVSSVDGIRWQERLRREFLELDFAMYAQNRYLGVAGQDVWISSETGEWVKHTSALPLRVFEIIYTNSVFVAVGRPGTIFTSPDGISWAPRYRDMTADASEALKGVTYANALFAAVGDGGRIVTSRDGIEWRSQGSGSRAYLADGTQLEGKLYVVGLDGVILSTADGVTWTREPSGSTAGLTGITTGDGLVLAVGQECQLDANRNAIFGPPLAVKSDGDGVWTTSPMDSSGYVRAVAFGNGLFVAVGSERPDGGLTFIWTSRDGILWTRQRPVVRGTVPYRENLCCELWDVAYGNGRFVAVGWGGAVISSTDGLSWELGKGLPFPRFSVPGEGTDKRKQ